MIFGIGTDIFEVKRMKERIEKEPSFIHGIFTAKEISYCNQFKNKAERLAARYAAKESFLKALGTGWRNGISFDEIEILNDSLGKPDIHLTGTAKQIISDLKIESIHVSISHIKDLAIAFVIINNNN